MIESASRSISVIVPCRNEAGFISGCIESILANDYPSERIEIVVVDGMSDDGTQSVVERYTRDHSNVRLLNNPGRTPSAAMNIGIRNTAGDFIARIDAHSTCEPRYLSKCGSALLESGADNVGGSWIVQPRDDTPIGRAIAYVLSHPFGVGNAYYKIGIVGRRWVDTVPFGFYRRDVFERIGVFNESLVRNQDLDLNLRLIRSGGRILLDPDITIVYFARSGLFAFAKHNFADAYWVLYGASFSRLPMSWRHLVPLAFVTIGPALAVASLVNPAVVPLLAVLTALYLGLSLTFAFRAATRRRRIEYLVTLPLVFTVRHIAYGMGSAWGLLRFVLNRFGYPRAQAVSSEAEVAAQVSEES